MQSSDIPVKFPIPFASAAGSGHIRPVPTASQIAIAWVLAKGASIVPIIGARTRKQLAESLGALELKISAADLAKIEAAVSANEVAGTRYDAYQMGHLDSEKVAT